MFYSQNIELVSNKNEKLAQELKQMFLVLAEEKIEVYSAESGDYVFSYDGLVLDDMINPAEAAENIVKENIPDNFTGDDVVIVFGLGAGYLIKNVLNSVSANVILLEPKTDIFRYNIEFVDYTELFSKSNLYIAKDSSEAVSLVKKHVVQNKSNIRIVYPDAYMQLLPEELSALENRLMEIISGN